uniref:CCHC-type domain-containing protein n=1 Tax=Magallana gigas TaxID=29159 RepID=A0A8W8IS71_MAGGI
MVKVGQVKAEQGEGPHVKDRACYYCKRPGHIQRDCSLYNRRQYRKPEDKKIDSPFADVILGNVIDKIEKMEVEKPADCLAVQTRAQTRLEAEETKPRPKKTDDGDDGLYKLNYDNNFGDEYGAPDPPFFIHIGDTWRRCMVTGSGLRWRRLYMCIVLWCPNCLRTGTTVVSSVRVSVCLSM